MRKRKLPKDGMVGLWFHTFDANGDFEQQLEIINRSGDAYVCRIYSWVDGGPRGCTVVSRNKILKLPLYESAQALNRAFEDRREIKEWMRLGQEAVQAHRALMAAPVNVAN
jgi:hypothetical protein